MAFNIDTFDSTLIGGNGNHRYRSTDDMAAILAANYFDNKELAYRVKQFETITIIFDTDGTPGMTHAVITVVDPAVPTVTVVQAFFGS